MHRIVTGVALAFWIAGTSLAHAQQPDSTLAPPVTPVPVDSLSMPPAATPTPEPVPPPAAQAVPPPPPPPPASKPPLSERIYYGGSVTLSFGSSTTRIGFFPMVAYKLTPRLSLGGELGYEYVDYDNPNFSAHNYGGGVFSRFRIAPPIYAHAEFKAVSYDIPDVSGNSSRETVPFLLVGGGFIKSVGPRTSAYAQVLFDLLQDENSPYGWDPIFEIGVGVGF
jgi:hypothetical protein